MKSRWPSDPGGERSRRSLHRTLLAMTSLLALPVMWATPAEATIYIGLQEAGYNGGAIDPVLNGTTPQTFTGSYGTFSTTITTGNQVPGVAFPDMLYSNDMSTSTSTAGTLTVWVTGTDFSQPVGTARLSSSFTANEVPSGWTVTEKTFYDPGNGIFTTTTPLQSATFSTRGVTGGSNDIGFATPFSITEEYILTATGRGTTNDTIDTSVSEPASLAILGIGLLGLMVIARRRQID